MRIAIIDDCAADRAILAEKLKAYLHAKELSYTLCTFSNAESFLEAFAPDKFQIIFLDIFMDGMTGMDAARIVYQKDKNCKIIFLTTTDAFSQQSYSVHAVYYLMKPIADEAFAQAMDFCQLLPQYKVPFLQVMCEGMPLRLDTAQILYIEYSIRSAKIHLKNRVLPVSGAFHSITEPLQEDPRFLLSIRGMMVNMQHIVQQQDDVFLLDNGEKIPISLRKKKVIAAAYRQYVFETMGEM